MFFFFFAFDFQTHVEEGVVKTTSFPNLFKDNKLFEKIKNYSALLQKFRFFLEAANTMDEQFLF